MTHDRLARDDFLEATPDTRALARALSESLFSPNEGDSNGEVANVVDGLFAIARGLDRVANAITATTGGPHD